MTLTLYFELKFVSFVVDEKFCLTTKDTKFSLRARRILVGREKLMH